MFGFLDHGRTIFLHGEAAVTALEAVSHSAESNIPFQVHGLSFFKD